ncbi:hypothetical protein AB1Y20_000251 [Prymnesium parvum]|uniref:Coiled-coil domain-containing protein 12 n=1 Tax=Prymnesium parvum TaxID=97485 RepID=A0AB34K7C1_PRYPA
MRRPTTASCVYCPSISRELPDGFTSSAAPISCRAESDAQPVLKFRNYQPHSEQLHGLGVEKPVVPSVEDQIDAAEIVHNDTTQEPLINLAPKRANWDLKRDLEPQLKKLRGMTDRAIIGLIAKRVAEEQDAESGGGGGPDLALAVEQQGQADKDDES